MNPHAPIVGDLGDGRQRIDRPGVRRAADRRDEQRLLAVGGVVVDRRGEVRRTQAAVLVGRDDPDLVVPEAELACGPRDRGVRLVRDVDHQALVHRPGEDLPGAGDRGEVRRRAARHEDAPGVWRVADPPGEPAQDGQLELTGAGGLAPRPGVDVHRAGDQVAERGRPRAGTRDVAEEAWVIEVPDVGQDVALESVEQGGERRAGGRWRPVQPGGQLLA
jgi:hypothetical protein